MAAFGQATKREVTLRGLILELTDLERLAKRPNPPYTEAQASSYDRASKSPTESWYANGDAGKFLRVERVRGRNEYVMADLKGPGVVVRIWSANPAGTIRFYFDREEKARFVWSMPELLQGRIMPFQEPIAYNASSGTNLYFPISYAKSLKITADESQGDRVKSLYYHVGYRNYPPGTRIMSLTDKDLAELKPLIERQAKRLLDPNSDRYPPRAPGTRLTSTSLIRSSESKAFLDLSQQGAIYEFRARLSVPGAPSAALPWASEFQLHNALRTVRLTGEFDGERCIDVPLGDFFGSAPGVNPYVTLPMEMRKDGWMVCRFVMPFARSAKLTAENLGPLSVNLETQVRVVGWRFGTDSYHFRAQWTGERTFTRPMRDISYLSVSGEGTFVGLSLHIANPVPTWWGEGDEKVYVDGEAFPSTFGTGSEDYFGYAWGSPELFARPYHAQPRCDGPGTRGHDSVVRFHVFDDIPYTKSLRIDMELWHWAEVDVSYDRTAYWYSRPGGTPPKEIERDLLLPVEISRPEPVKGAIEGEKMEIVSKGGGETEIQGFFELSNEGQLWWRDAKPGDKLVLKFEARGDGSFEVAGNFCMASDYGIHAIRINGQEVIKPVDFWSSGLKWQRVTLGVYDLKVGSNTLEIECAGHRDNAVPRHMFGLDYIVLTRK